MNTTTIERILAKAAFAGQAAYASDQMRSPFLSATIRSMLLDEDALGEFAREVNHRIMKAFTDGFDSAATWAAEGVLTEVPC